MKYFIILFALMASVKSDGLKLSVYYETLCPDSIKFVTKQLAPSFAMFSEMVELELIPAGKADFTMKDDKIEFSCQHGPRECEGNTIQTCALHMVDDASKTLPFISCMMSSYPANEFGESCAKQHKLNWTEINDCATSEQGQNYFKSEILKTKSLDPKLTFVPWILLNDTHTDSVQTKAFGDLKSLLCESLEEKPSHC